MASRASPVVDGGLDASFLSDFEACDSFANFRDCSRELVAKCDGDCFFGDGMRFKGYKVRSSEIFVKICRVLVLIQRQSAERMNSVGMRRGKHQFRRCRQMRA